MQHAFKPGCLITSLTTMASAASTFLQILSFFYKTQQMTIEKGDRAFANGKGELETERGREGRGKTIQRIKACEIHEPNP